MQQILLFISVLILLFISHEFLHVYFARLFGYNLIAMFFIFPSGIAVLTEDENRTLFGEIVVKAAPALITIFVATQFLFFDFILGVLLVFMMFFAGAIDFWNSIKAFLSRKYLKKYFVESEKRDLKKIFELKKKGRAKIFVINEKRWNSHLKRANLH